jgi:hypothetical protein
MTHLTSSLIRSSILAVGLAGGLAHAQNANYAPGDLVLYFQKEGGANTVYASLGNAATKYRGASVGPGAANSVNFLNIGDALVAAFGTDWASDTSIYAGLAGVWGTSNTNAVALQDGDPHRTIYASRARTTVGTTGQAGSSAWDLSTAGNSAMTAGSSAIVTQNNRLETAYTTAVAVSPVGDSQIDEQNPFTAPGVQGPAFSLFGGGVQQVGSAGSFGSLGAAGSVEFALDLYRIQSISTAPGQVGFGVTALNRVGSYEGTVTINSSGMVSFISQGAASSAYDAWMAAFTSITSPADKLVTADPDGDGATNLSEFAFGGDPGNAADNGFRGVRTVDANADQQLDITLTLEVRSGATFSLSGNDLVSGTVDDLTYRIQGSTDLVNWSSTVSEVTPALGSGSPSSGYVFKTFRLNAGNGLSGKGFLRASVTK